MIMHAFPADELEQKINVKNILLEQQREKEFSGGLFLKDVLTDVPGWSDIELGKVRQSIVLGSGILVKISARKWSTFL